MLENKELKAEQLEKVSGGDCCGDSHDGTDCPECNTRCRPSVDIVTEGEGCDAETYWLCPNCGHKWK